MLDPNLTRPPVTDPIRAYRYRDGLYAADLITAAVVHLDFFTWLSSHPSDAPGICRALGLAPRPLDVMLTLCAASGFVRRDGEAVLATDVAREHLSSGSPFYLGPYYASLKDRPVVQDFLRVLRTDHPAHWGGARDGHDWHKSMEDEAFARSFTAAMDCRGLYLAQAMAGKVDLAGHTRLLDVGGGSGIYACVLAAHNPSLAAVVFDQAPVDRMATRLIDERGCSDRVSVRAGNFFADAWPHDCDVHLLSNVVHDWPADDVRVLFTLSHGALPAGGRIVVHDAFINADKTGPLPVAEYSTILMHSTRGKCYSTGEYTEMLEEAGFGTVTFADTAADRGVMTATKAG